MMQRYFIPILSGIIFGAGLALGGMTDPARVRGFLDVFGNWDPTLAFVMGGAVIVMVIAWQVQRRRTSPIFTDHYALPTRSDLTPRLVGGSALFGVGWGIAGLCPGPGIAALVIEPMSAAIFVFAMIAGMALVRLVEGPN